MTPPAPTTLGELRASGYRARTVRDELRENLIAKIKSGETLFPGIHGYDDSVIPQLVNAILARHDFILLGLRGQAKSRILRQLVTLLDPHIPVIAGSEVNDDPLAPISKHGRRVIEEHGDDAPVEWLAREQRYLEKLATPDVTIADIIGDLDPIKAARGGHILSDELTIHFGMLPRANRGIFAMNELPDLSPRIQVGLFNILEEGDVQIKGYPVRLPLDLLIAFTANPEDYTARGKIVTPLKDRIAAEIRTHYPKSLDTSIAITEQEAWVARGGPRVFVPPFMRDIMERVTALARMEERVDQSSGVSQRMPIAILETAVSSAERRAILQNEAEAVPRIGDVYAALPAITGKLELEYEGEMMGARRLANHLVMSAAGVTFDELELQTQGDHDVLDLDETIEYFESGGIIQVAEDATATACVEGFRRVPRLFELAELLGLMTDESGDGEKAAACEVVLEGLAYNNKITRTRGGAYRATKA